MARTVAPFQPRKVTAAEFLEDLRHGSFQARNLGEAFRIWRKMLETPRNAILLGLAGAMTAAGMRRTLAFLLKERMIDCLVSTGANLFHDIYETLGDPHYRVHPRIGDQTLLRHHLDRVYDTLADESRFREIDRMLLGFGRELAKSGKTSLSTREFFYLLGKKLDTHKKEDGIITSAFRAGVPIYCPSIADSSFGIGMSPLCVNDASLFHFDVLKDVYETAQIAVSGDLSSVITVGGGVPKNFIQQTCVTADYLGHEMPGHRFAVQITVDAPHWGGLSGATFEEAESWGKIHAEAERATVYCDATIALPLLASGLAETAGDAAKRRVAPRFNPGDRTLRIRYR